MNQTRHYPKKKSTKIAEAEEFAEADKRLKAQVEMRNMADQIVYQTRRTIEEAGEKLNDEDKAPVLSKVDELESLLQNEEGVAKELDEIDEAAVQAKVKEIEEGMHAISASCMRQLLLRWQNKKRLALLHLMME